MSRTDANRRRILDAARGLFDRPGYDRATVADLAREAKVAVATIYNLYPGGKPTVAAALWYDQYRTVSETADRQLARRPAIDVLATYVKGLVRKALDDIALTNAMLTGVQAATIRAGGPPVTHDDPRLFAPIPADAARIVALGQEQGSLREDIATMSLATHVVNSTLHRVMTRPKDRANDTFGFVWTMLVDGITLPRQGH